MDKHEVLVKVLVEAAGKAALATKKFIGTGEKEAGDQAAVDAMRAAFEGKNLNATVIVGEGEKDEAPMLYVGEKLGDGTGLPIDIAVDPVEGTRLMAEGKPNAITVIAATDQDGFWDAGPAYYMNKLVVGKEAKGVIDITKSTAENLESIAAKLKKRVEDLGVYVLNKPRHETLIQEIKACGAKAVIHDEGDVVGSILALVPGSEVDVLMGVGGAPEAVITAAAVQVMGGEMQAQLAPQLVSEKENLAKAGVDLERIYHLNDLISSNQAVFVAAGVTSGALLKGIDHTEGGDTTEYIVLGFGQGEIKRGMFGQG